MDTWTRAAMSGFLIPHRRVAIRRIFTGTYSIPIAATRKLGPTERCTTAMTTFHEGSYR